MVDSAVDDGATVPLPPTDDMEEGELSEDEAPHEPGTLRKPGTGPHGKEGLRMEVPDLLKDVSGVMKDMIVDEETAEKINRRAARFQTGGSISFPQVSALYRSMKISSDPGKRAGHRLEVVHVWSKERINQAALQEFFSEYQPLSVDLSGTRRANVSWATPANSAKAILGLSKAIGEPEVGKKVKHVIGFEEEPTSATVVEAMEADPVGDMVHPEDIGVELPEGGPWRLATRAAEDLPVMLLRFGQDSDLYSAPVPQHHASRDRNPRFSDPVGIISRSKREELLAEQERALLKAEEAKAPVDRRNPWGGVAERWAEEQRGGSRSGIRLGPKTLGGNMIKDWDAPREDDEEEVMEVVEGKRSIKERLDLGAKVEEDQESEEDEEDMGWMEKMKRPRMGMVADMVEKKTVARSLSRNISMEMRQQDAREVIKRKVPMGRREEEEDEEEEIKIDVGQRRIVQPRRRLGERLGLAGRLGDRLGARMDEGRDLREVMSRGRLSQDRERGREGVRQRWHSGDSLELDDGADLRDSLESGTNMVIQVHKDSEDEEEAAREEERRIRKELDRKRRERDRKEEEEKERKREEREEERERLKEKERRQRQKIEELKEKEEALLREKKRREKERKMEEVRRLREKEKKLEELRRQRERQREKPRRRRDDESSDDSQSDSGSEESGSESESESGTSSGSSEESSSGSEESSDEEERRPSAGAGGSRRDEQERRRAPGGRERERIKGEKEKPKERGGRGKEGGGSSKHEGGRRSEKKESSEDQKKAAELKDKLKNYLKKAKEAKEAKKKVKK